VFQTKLIHNMRQISIYLVLMFCSVVLLTSCKQTAVDTTSNTAAPQPPPQQLQQQTPQSLQGRKVRQPGIQQKEIKAPPGKTQTIKSKQATLQRPKHEPKVPGGKVNWMTFSEVEEAMKKEKRKVFVDLYTDWCGWCKVLDKATFADKRVADYMNENYYAIKFDAQDPKDIVLGGKKYSNPNFNPDLPKRARNATHQLAVKYGTGKFPTVAFLDEKLKLIKAVPGFKGADQFLPLLTEFNQ